MMMHRLSHPGIPPHQSNNNSSSSNSGGGGAIVIAARGVFTRKTMLVTVITIVQRQCHVQQQRQLSGCSWSGAAPD